MENNSNNENKIISLNNENSSGCWEDDSDLLTINLEDEDIEYDGLLTYCRQLK